ncbi:endonuclease III [Aquipluma nitroreducens]|uniref:Endonuclease III n=1 Tax=Aquipluma nitroreducens TaxID=2010828 RepID=A0A5K7SB72_9BACT|nr:endonuclease III [Aquipluma nitroreducens]BBE18687.1 endonuclease III [Aquipluma nitroreducens]
METNWEQALQPLFQQYGKRRHPLDYQNRYQLVVMVILSAQDSDKHINELAPDIFAAYPTLNSLSHATEADLQQHIGSVRNWGNKAKWLTKLAQTVGEDENIPRTLEGLTKLPGLGRKSANVIIRESGDMAEGVIVDLHVLRVAPRLGIADEKDAAKPEKIEKQIMAVIPQEFWNEGGMSISFLGRELCRPTNPKCTECLVNSVCQFFQNSGL